VSRSRTLLAGIALVLLGGCATTFVGVTPVAPQVGNPNFPVLADSLQPLLQWARHPDAERYDLIIYEGIKTSSAWEGTKRAVGREAYYREGLMATEHRVEQPLKPDTEYYWSVRLRRGTSVSPWSRYDYTAFFGTGYMKAGNQLFIFKTPKTP